MGTNITRNDPCHCGSNMKYKKCCIGLDIFLNKRKEGPSQYINSPISYSMVWPKQISYDDYINKIKKIPSIEAIKILTHINTILSNKKDENSVQIEYARMLLSPINFNKVKRLNNHSSNYLFLSDNQITNLIKLIILLDGNQDGVLKKHDLGELLLVQNDYFEKTRPSSVSKNTAAIGLIVRQRFATYTDDLYTPLPRIMYLITVLSKELKHCSSNYIDLEHEFLQSTGLSLSKYVSIIYSLIAKWSIPLDGQEKKLSPLNINTCLKDITVTKKELSLALHDCALNIEEYIKALQKEIVDHRESFYQNGTITKYPLLSIDHEVYPLSLRLLKNKISSYIYYTLFHCCPR